MKKVKETCQTALLKLGTELLDSYVKSFTKTAVVLANGKTISFKEVEDILYAKK